MAEPDWLAWHQPYDDPDSYLSQRLDAVRSLLADALDRAPAGPLPVVSMCAGQGLDVIGVLPTHPRRGDVRARLVELDPRNTARARELADAAGLEQVEVVTGDASLTDAYAGAVPAAVVLACGIFGNISDADIQATVAALPMFCAPGATVLWTRHRYPPDVTPSLRGWFAEAGFSEVAWIAPEDRAFGVGAHHWSGGTVPFEPGRTLFTFVGDGSGAL